MSTAHLFDKHEQDSTNHQNICLNGKKHRIICLYLIACSSQAFEALIWFGEQQDSLHDVYYLNKSLLFRIVF